jgi:hypothetical protein
MDQEAEFLPKFVSAPVTVNQKVASDGTPGTGMLEFVGNNPPQFVPCPFLSEGRSPSVLATLDGSDTPRIRR